MLQERDAAELYLRLRDASETVHAHLAKAEALGVGQDTSALGASTVRVSTAAITLTDC